MKSQLVPPATTQSKTVHRRVGRLMAVAGLALAAGLVAPATSSAQSLDGWAELVLPKCAPGPRCFAVPESTRGVQSNRWLLPGETVAIAGGGTIDSGWWHHKTVGPAGWLGSRAGADYPMPIQPVDSLIAGVGGRLQYVGPSATLTNSTGATAAITFRTNDNNPGNGSGSFTAELLSRTWARAGHVNNAVSLASTTRYLLVLTSDGRIWYRDKSMNETNWVPLETRPEFIKITAHNDSLYAVTTGNRLLMRSLSEHPRWVDIGHAYNVTGITNDGAYFYAATSDNRLWRRPMVHSEIDWTVIGSADYVRDLSVAGTDLMAIGRDEVIRWRHLGNPIGPTWVTIGPSRGIAAIANAGPQGDGGATGVWVATRDGQLLLGYPNP